ncbi:MAG: PKD domain-containing protein [Chitinophagales bacterium]|nr:PKD domain-containing protein [Chitinophagales bacterium]
MNFRVLVYISILFCFHTAFSNQPFVLPKNGQTIDSKTVSFLWNPNSFTTNYKLQIATDSNFRNISYTILTPLSSYSQTFADYGTYYCRFKRTSELIWSPTIKIELIDLNNDNNLISWFDANENVIQSGSVSSWKDRKVPTRVASQNNVPQQPLYISTIPRLNNRNVLSFNGVFTNPMVLNITPSINTTNFTFFCIRNFKPNTSNVQFFLGGSSHGFSSEVLAFNEGCSFSGLNGSVLIAPQSTLRSDYSIYTITDSTLEINKQRINFSQFIGTKTVSQLALTNIGARVDAPNLAYKGEIAELIMFDTILGNIKKNSIYSYLINKYAPPVNLGIDTVAGSSFSDSIVLNAGNRFSRYLWSNGDTTPTTKVVTAGTYKVITTDIFGTVSEDDIEVYPYRRLKGAVVNFCPGDSVDVSLGLDASYAIVWSNGKTTSNVTFKTPGQYTVSITKNGKTVLDTITVTKFLDTTPLVYLPERNQSDLIRICGGERIYIKNDSLFESFQWSTGSTTNSDTTFSSKDIFISYVEKNGCTLSDTIAVLVAGLAPKADFEITSSICQNSSTSFNDISIPPAGVNVANWKWSFSNGDSSRLQNSTTIFNSSGIAFAAIKITTTQGCSDSIFKSFIVNRKPVPSFYNLLSCADLPTTFVDQTIANSATVSDWSWDFNGLGFINGIQNPSFRFPTSGVYTIRLKATNSNGCSDTVSNTLRVSASPVSNFSFDAVCGKTPVSLKFLATVESPNTIPNLNWGSWDFGDGTFETAIRNPQHVYPEPGTYNVILKVNSDEGCSDTAIRQVKVYDFPIVDFTVSQTQCVGKEIQFSDISSTPDGTPITTWNWFFSGEATDTVQNPKYTFNTQGNYIIQLNAKNAVGCSGTKLRSIAVSAPPQPKFTFSPQNGLPPLCVTYTNQSPVNGNYLWDYGDGGSLIEGFNPPQHCYNTIGTYPIKLIATDFRGCTESLIKFILVDKANLDAVMTSVTIIPNGEFYKIQVSIKNNSNIEITALGLSLQLGGGSVIRENWTGSLLPGQTTVYVFTGEIKPGESGQIPVVCATIDNVNNNAAEDRTDNNTSCKELSVGSFDILNIYPNPALDNINFGIMLPKDGKVNIRFIDVLGQQMYSKDFDGAKGYNNFNMSTLLLNAAVYVAEVSFDGEVVRKKFMRKDRK